MILPREEMAEMDQEILLLRQGMAEMHREIVLLRQEIGKMCREMVLQRQEIVEMRWEIVHQRPEMAGMAQKKRPLPQLADLSDGNRASGRQNEHSGGEYQKMGMPVTVPVKFFSYRVSSPASRPQSLYRCAGSAGRAAILARC